MYFYILKLIISFGKGQEKLMEVVKKMFSWPASKKAFLYLFSVCVCVSIWQICLNEFSSKSEIGLVVSRSNRWRDSVYSPVAGEAASRPTGVASRRTARARWSAAQRTGSPPSGDPVRLPPPSLCPRSCSRRPPARSPSFSPAYPRSFVGATRAVEPRSTARVDGSCRLSHLEAAEDGLSAASTSRLRGKTHGLLSLSLEDTGPSSFSQQTFTVFASPLSPPPLSLLYYSLQCHMVWGLHHLFPKERCND